MYKEQTGPLINKLPKGLATKKRVRVRVSQTRDGVPGGGRARRGVGVCERGSARETEYGAREKER